MVPEYLNTKELAKRWQLKPETLKQWRYIGHGPQYLRIGGRVIYRAEDISHFENRNLRQSTSQAVVF